MKQSTEGAALRNYWEHDRSGSCSFRLVPHLRRSPLSNSLFPALRDRPTVSSWGILRALSQYLRFCADGSPEPSDRDVSSVGSGLYARTGRVWRPVHTEDADQLKACGIRRSSTVGRPLTAGPILCRAFGPAISSNHQTRSSETVLEAATRVAVCYSLKRVSGLCIQLIC